MLNLYLLELNASKIVFQHLELSEVVEHVDLVGFCDIIEWLRSEVECCRLPTRTWVILTQALDHRGHKSLR